MDSYILNDNLRRLLFTVIMNALDMIKFTQTVDSPPPPPEYVPVYYLTKTLILSMYLRAYMLSVSTDYSDDWSIFIQLSAEIRSTFCLPLSDIINTIYHLHYIHTIMTVFPQSSFFSNNHFSYLIINDWKKYSNFFSCDIYHVIFVSLHLFFLLVPAAVVAYVKCISY